MEKKNTTVICVIDGGNLIAAYSDNPGVSLKLLDYDIPGIPLSLPLIA